MYLSILNYKICMRKYELSRPKMKPIPHNKSTFILNNME